MDFQPLVLAELEEAIQNGTEEKRIATLRSVTNLFLSDAERFNETQITLFDNILCHLVKRVERRAIIELSRRLAPVDNAPVETIRRLAQDHSIAIAQPVLSQSARLTTGDLVEIAETKGQQHLLAIAGRNKLASVVTDILVTRGDHEVRSTLAENASASFSEKGFATLVKSAEDDDGLAERIGLRLDLPLRLLRDLLQKASEAVRGRLLAIALPEQRDNIQQALAKISKNVQRELAAPRELDRAIKYVEQIKEQGKLNDGQLVEFAAARQHEEIVAALSALTAMPVELIAPVMKSIRSDGLLVLCKAAGLKWRSTKAILESRIVKEPMTENELQQSEQDYSRLSQSTAQRTLRFWKVRSLN
jgi:uncharacterized protein (DUF2336 family)